MRKPNHLILDFEILKSNNNPYWISTLIANGKWNFFLLNDINIFKNYKLNNYSVNEVNILKNISQSTMKFDQSKLNLVNSASRGEKSPLKNNLKAKYFLNLSQKLNTTNDLNVESYAINTLDLVININFLKKERLYTKLKYSRSPAFDIVSGGSAALLSGFIGFLVSEKFGFELVDSGDFYYLFMYLVFIAFSVRPLVFSLDNTHSFYNAIDPREILNFYVNLAQLLFKYFK